ncbi:SNF2 family N-terminal domain-domain-containing protein [Leucosporidium creatinivorum]|uniref:SNF2 family N-terminal domain-domain-containing protein n=1 Tax=Leucosporidium creatinivorum TaxID=106004 RepID=A0A1Y2FWV7_9BASI|nr:SNF2 family N-terminal domain-domain-containing protein [Leucosporidium creatinivorum]
MPPRRSTSARTTTTPSPRSKSRSPARELASTRPSSVEAEVAEKDEDGEYTPSNEKDVEMDDAQALLPPTTNSQVRAHFDRLIQHAKLYTDALGRGMEDEATKEFTVGDGEEEASTTKGKGKKRKAPVKKDSPSKKPKEEVKEQSKLVSGGTLKDFQRVGVDWMIARHMNASGCLLADEMGTGKTIQSIAFLAYLREQGMHSFNLVVCPKAVLGNWELEFRRFAPSMPIMVYKGNPTERKALRAEMRRLANAGDDSALPTILTTYSFVRSDKTLLARSDTKHDPHFEFGVLVIDEAQNIKSAKTKTHQALKQYAVDFRLLLTGTPLQNNLDELYALLSFILPEVFNDAEAWTASFNFDSLTSADGSALSKADEFALLVAQLHLIVKPFMLRRLKKDVQKDLPLKKEYILRAPMTERQRELDLSARNKSLRALLIKESMSTSEPSATPPPAIETDEPGQTISQRAGRRKSGKNTYVELTDGEFFDEMENPHERETQTAEEVMEMAREANDKSSRSRINNQRLDSMIMSLRLVANHPYLTDKSAMVNVGSEEWMKDVVAMSGKMMLLDRMLPKLFAEGHKVLIFSQFTTQLDIIAAWADVVKEWGYYQIGGGSPADQEEIDDFNTNTDEDSCKLFLLSTRAGGVGLNLVGADTVIIFDSDWNPQNDLQAMDRAHRIGQTKPVLVFRFETENSIDGLIIDRATRKRKLEKVVLGEGTFKGTDADTSDVIAKAKGKGKTTKSKTDNALQMEELAKRLLATEGQKITFAEGDQVLSDEQLEQLLDRSDKVMLAKGVASSPSKKNKASSSAIFTTMESIGMEEAEGGDDLAAEFDVEGEVSAQEAAEQFAEHVV